ncbi:DegT/DnrJ/EryC1/StrS family aminotransferase [Paenibacillus sp. FSL M7-0831]|uniref:DegT/DnrJ/EryC1/StrS family aminotransferase n=1 Tax=Paenibacillus sp. FSL M7-0831 TaxID=2975314 RepID=UPI0030FB743C
MLVQRNVYAKSVLNGLMLAGAKAVFLEPQVDESSGLATAPSTETVAAALTAYPEAKGVLVTMPNYYGMGTDLAPLAEACHRHDVPLLVDEAHGAHYEQHPRLPRSALASGADVVVNRRTRCWPRSPWEPCCTSRSGEPRTAPPAARHGAKLEPIPTR